MQRMWVVRMQIILLVMSLIATAAHAEIYRWVDSSGNTIYSDQPHKNAETVKLPDITSYTSEPVKNTATTPSEPAAKAERYTTFKINEPANESTVRENSGRVVVSLDVAPAIYNGDLVVFDIDGQIFKQAVTRQVFTDMPRGTHVLKVHIINAQGEAVTPIVSSQFYLKRASILNRPNPTN